MMLQRIAGKLAALRVERALRWVEGSHHCTVCGVQYGPNSECYCDTEKS